MWQLSRITHAAFPRPNLGINTANSQVNGRDVLVAPDNGSAIVSVEGNGTVRLYDPIADTFTITRTAVFANNTLRGTVSAAPDGSFYVVDNQVFNSVLGAQGSIGPSTIGLPVAAANTAAAAFGVATFGNAAVRVQAAVPPNTPVQSLQRFNIFTLQPDVQVSLPEQVLDINLAQIGQANFARLWPPRPVALELGVNNQTQLLRRGMAVNSTDVYVLTFRD